MPTPLEKLLVKQRQIDARVKALQARDRTKDRKRENRKKLLEGVALRAWVAADKMSQDEYRQILNHGLTLDRDRALFDLPLRNPSPSQDSAEPEKRQGERRKTDRRKADPATPPDGTEKRQGERRKTDRRESSG